MIRISNSFKKWTIAIREKLISIPADPHKIRLGYALGVFLSATPFIGVKVPIAIFLTALLKWNKIASIIGVFHVNLLTAPLFYGFSYLVGKSVLHQETDYALPDDFTLKAFYDLFTGNFIIFLNLLVGGGILGVPMAFAAYFFSFSFIRRKNKTGFRNFSGYKKEWIASLLKIRRFRQPDQP